MKKIILIFCGFLIAVTANAQVVEAGAGYFTDLFGAFVKDLGASKQDHPGMPGLVVWGEYGLNMRRNITASLFVANGTIKHGYQTETGIFSGGKVSDTYFYVDINFKKNIYFGKNKKRFGIAPGLGVFFRNLETTVPGADLGRDQNENLVIKRLYMDNTRYQDLGLSVNLDIKYRFKVLYAGIRAKTFFTIYYGMGGLVVTPFVGINLKSLKANHAKSKQKR